MADKAYRVYEKAEDSDNGMGIVFAASASEARLKAWHGDLDITADSYADLRARREPWADTYAKDEHIPLRAYLENGWWWTCYDCSRHVDLENIGGVTEDDEPLCERCAKEQGLTPPDWALEGKGG